MDDCNFTSFLNSTLRISHVRTEIMKNCVQWDPVYDTKDFPSGIEPGLLHQLNPLSYLGSYKDPGQVWEISNRTRNSQQMDRILLRAIQSLELW